LFRVRTKSDTYYVQTEEEMKAQLLQKGLGDAVFETADGQQIQGEDMTSLCQTLASMEEALIALERRGISLRAHAERADLETGKLPVIHVFLGRQEFWFRGRVTLEKFLKEQEAERGGELPVDNSDQPVAAESGDEEEAGGEELPDGSDNGGPQLHITELHEVRTINAGLKELARLGFDVQSLIPQERTGVEEPRYVLRRGEGATPLEDLRGLPPAVRAAGEKGLHVTRFKGLGEMNAEELRETTLDPANRTLVQVSMRDLGAADEMFRVLMGDKVEPRREFIEKHALDVRNLDV
jgi:DNA gyrase subunit B